MLLVITLVLVLLPLVGIAFLFLSAPSLTVDNLFMALILAAMSGIMLLNVVLEFSKGKSAKGGSRGQSGGSPLRSTAGSSVERGRVESVQFYESHVGQTNKSVVTLSDGAKALRMLLFSGDMRNSLPIGKKVEIAYRDTDGGKVLLNVEYV
jgi:hypothetical protein